MQAIVFRLGGSNVCAFTDEANQIGDVLTVVGSEGTADKDVAVRLNNDVRDSTFKGATWLID